MCTASSQPLFSTDQLRNRNSDNLINNKTCFRQVSRPVVYGSVEKENLKRLKSVTSLTAYRKFQQKEAMPAPYEKKEPEKYEIKRKKNLR